MTRQTAQAQPTVTCTPEQLQTFIDQAVTKIMAAKEATAQSNKSDEMEAATVRAFKKKGYTDIQPRKNIMTYNRWLAEGRRVKPGEKSVKVKSLRLFHVSQTEVLSAKDKADAVTEMQATIRRHNDTKKATDEAHPQA